MIGAKRPGYYLSTYIDTNRLRNVLDVKLRHDQTIALWRYEDPNLELVRYWELERISGIKQHPKALYDPAMQAELVNHLLSEESLSLDDICGIWGSRDIDTDDGYRTQFNQDLTFHSMAHLLTAIYFDNDDPFSGTIIALSLDAGPDSLFERDAHLRNYYAGCIISNGEMETFPIESPGRLWSYARKKFGLREGTLMALASATSASFELSLESYDLLEFYDEGARSSAREVVDSIFAHSSDNLISMDQVPTDVGADKDRFTLDEIRLSAVMKHVAAMSERIAFRVIDRILAEHEINPKLATIALAGGFALNCPTNSSILQRYGFSGFQAPPCISDTGIALGVGLAAFLPELSEGTARVELDTAYFGSCGGVLKEELSRYSKFIESVEVIDYDDVASDLVDNGIAIWVTGRSEIGPRALGNRSILADPRSLDVKNRLNSIKKRQWWRPVAPVVMDEFGDEYFLDYRCSPYMLLNFVIREEKLNKVPGVVHLDGTARVQSSTARRNPQLYGVISAFHRMTGVPILGNTSLNDAGEPIINRLGEAIEFALHKGIRTVYFEGTYRVRLVFAEAEYGEPPSPRGANFFAAGDTKPEVVSLAEQYGLSIEEMTFFFDRLTEFNESDLESSEVRACVQSKTIEYLGKFPGELRR